MIRIPLEFAQSGMKLAKNLYGNNGSTLLTKDAILNEQYIIRLNELKVPYIYIQIKNSGIEEIPEIINETTRTEAVLVVNEVFNECYMTKQIDTSKMKDVVNNLVDEILSNRKFLVQLSEMRSLDNYIFAHSVDVTILAILTGLNLQYNQLQLRDLGLGALFHDIGKIVLNEKSHNFDHTLTPEEIDELSHHPEIGFNILRQDKNLSLPAAHVAFQHHEYIDGSGIPRGLKGSEIHQFAKIVAIADTFDTMVNNRISTKAYLHHDAAEIIRSYSGKLFDPVIVNAFLVNIALYPIGSIVELSNHEKGIVIDINKYYPQQPIVRIIDQSLGELEFNLQEIKEVDLSTNPDIYIKDVIPFEKSPLYEGEKRD